MQWCHKGTTPDNLSDFISSCYDDYVNIDWNRVCKAAMVRNDGPHAPIIKHLVMQCFQKHFNPDSGVDDSHAAGTLQIWLHQVLGGRWQVVVGKYCYLAGAATELCVTMVEDTMVVMYKFLPGMVDVFSDDSAVPVW